MAGGYFSNVWQGKPVSAQQKEQYHGDTNEAILRKLKLYVSEGVPGDGFPFQLCEMAGFPSIPLRVWQRGAAEGRGLTVLTGGGPEEIMKDLISLKKNTVLSMVGDFTTGS